MKIRVRAVFCALLFLTVSSCAAIGDLKWPGPVPDSELDQRFSPSELREDLLEARARIEEIHPDAYARTSREEVDAAVMHALDDIEKPLTRREFAPRFQRFLATFGDGHTSGGFPSEEFSREAKANGRYLPFDARDEEGVIRIDPLYEPVHDMDVGDRLIALQGQPIEVWFADWVGLKCGPARWKRKLVAESLRASAWQGGIELPALVEWEKPDGRRCSAWVSGIPWHNRSVSSGVRWEFKVLEGDIGYLDFRSMDDRETWQKFLEATFARMKNENLRGLVIDLRKNGGGDSSLGDDLIQYVTSKDYRMAARKDWKASRAYRDFLKTRLSAWISWLPVEWVHPVGRKFFGAEEGSIVAFESEMDHPVPDSDAPLRFEGPVVLLIGAGTFSSALMTADAFATYRLATVMGEETAECPTGFGEVMGLALPHTGLRYQVSSARFVRASGDATDLAGVRPDIEVKPTADDIQKGIDTALEHARRFVRDAPHPATR